MASTLQGFFCAVTVIQLVSLYFAGLLGMEILLLDLKLVPLVICGVWLGGLLYSRLDQDFFRRLVLAGILCVGCSFCLRNLPFPG